MQNVHTKGIGFLESDWRFVGDNALYSIRLPCARSLRVFGAGEESPTKLINIESIF
jgi:hypothetical protein